MAGDAYFAEVATLLHFEGVDASTTFTDSARTPVTWTHTGTAQLDTADKKFGDASLYQPSRNDSLTAASAGSGFWNFLHDGTGDWTLDMWVNPLSLATSIRTLFDTAGLSAGNYGFSLYLNTDGSINADVSNGTGGGVYAAEAHSSASAITTSTWQFVRVTVSGTTLSIAVDGSTVATDTLSSPSATNHTYDARIGRYAAAADFGYTGHIDEFRVTNGTARSLSEVPTGPFPDTDRIDPLNRYVASLLRFNGDYTDEAGAVWTVEGTTSIDTTTPIYGAGSGDFTNSTSGMTLTGGPSLGNGPWTIEWSMRDGSHPGYNAHIFDTDYSAYVAGKGFAILALTADSGKLSLWSNAIKRATGTTNVYDGNPHDICVMHTGSNLYLFVDGAVEITLADSTSWSFTTYYLGRYYSSTGFSAGCVIDEFRLTENIARYSTSGYVPSLPHDDVLSWNPSFLNPQLWLDAADTSTLTQAAGEVSQWDDKSGNAYTFSQATPAARPDTLSSWNTVHFDGGDRLVSDQAAADFAWMSDTGPNSFYIVFKPGEVASPNAIYVFYGTGQVSSGTRGFNFAYDDRSSISRNDGLITFVSKGTSTAPIDHYEGDFVTSNDFNLVTGEYDPSLTSTDRSTLSWAGDTDLTGNTSSVTMTTGTPAYTLNIGGTGAGSLYLVGEIAEIVHFDYWLNDDQRRKMEGYLAWKWGLEADLPSSHIYSAAPPDATDTYWDDVHALAKFEDGDASTLVADEKDGTWTLSGATSEVTTDQAKWGTGSVLCNSTFAALSLTNPPTLGTDDFTIEFWAAPVQAHQAFGRIFQTEDGDVLTGISCVVATTSENSDVRVYSSSNGSGTWDVLNFATILTAPTSDQFYHFCFMRSAGTLYIFVDGVQKTSASYSGTFRAGSTWVYGGQTNTTSRNAGYAFDDIRVTPGAARYNISGFTPPPESFPTALDETNYGYWDSASVDDAYAVYSDSDRTVTKEGSASTTAKAFSTVAVDGEFAVEFAVDGKASGRVAVGVTTDPSSLSLSAASDWMYRNNGTIYYGGSTSVQSAWASGEQIISVWRDSSDNIHFALNGVEQGSGFSGAGTMYFAFWTDNAPDIPYASVNSGFYYFEYPELYGANLTQNFSEAPVTGPTTVNVGVAEDVEELLPVAPLRSLETVNVGVAEDVEELLPVAPYFIVNVGVAEDVEELLPVTSSYAMDSEIVGPDDITIFYGQTATFIITITSDFSTPPYTVDWYNDKVGLVYSGPETSINFTPGPADTPLLWWAVVTDNGGLQGQSRIATMAVVPAQLELSWSIENGRPETTVIVYQSIAWSVYDALTDSEYENFQCPVRTYRGISIEDGHTYWIPFYDKSARCQRGPLVNDAYNRYYWTQDGQGLRYDTLQNLEWNSFTEGYDVGIPPPVKVPAVAAPPGDDPDTDIVVTRAYVYTYESVFGEEGPPSLPTTADGVDGDLWKISNLLTGPNDGKRRKIGKKNIYRTVPSQTGKYSYHYVGSVSINTTEYFDRAFDEEIAENRTLESLYWFPPPDDLNGLIAHPNGFFVGYTGRDVHFSEPYRPHAWNPNYTVSTLGEVVGFGVFGSSLVVCTTSFPYVLTGIHPQAMVMTQHDTAEPCLSRYGIVSMPFGVYYPGPNGLMLASPQGFTNATQQLMTKEEWQNRYQVKTFDAAKYQSQYVALYNTRKGIMFAPDEPLAALVDIDLAAGTYEPDQADSIFTDEYSGKTYLLSNCEMYEWNPVSGAPLEFDWTSMEFDTADPVNFGASRIIWYSNYTPPTPEQTWAWRVYNTARIAAAPLHPMNFAEINGVNVISGLVYDLGIITDPDVDQVKVQEYLDNFAQIKQAFHWGPLVWVPVIGEAWPNTPYVIMELIANGEVVYQKLIGHDRMFRLPAGFKATRFKIRLRSNIHIQSVKVAETGKELAHF